VAGARDPLPAPEPDDGDVVAGYLTRGKVRVIDQPGELASLPHLLDLMRTGGGQWLGRAVRPGRVVQIDALGFDRLRVQVFEAGHMHVRTEQWSYRDGTYPQHFVDRILRDVAEDGPRGPAALVLVDHAGQIGVRLDLPRLAKTHNVAVGVIPPAGQPGHEPDGEDS
jgi:hypothetical protein